MRNAAEFISFSPRAILRATPEPFVALSVKQPWASLIVAGIKTVEVRTWSARRRGRLLIHAGKTADDRPEGWELIATPELLELSRLRGGIIGVVNLVGCVSYSDAGAFSAAVDAHRNRPEWFRRGLHGFVFADPRSIPFQPCTGRTMFFTVEPIPESLLPPSSPRSG